MLNTGSVHYASKGAVERFAFQRELHTGRPGMQPGTPALQPTAMIHLSDDDVAAVNR